MNRVLDILKDRSLTYHQQIKDLVAYAESTIEVLNIDDETKKLIDEGTACVIQQGRDIAGVLSALGSEIKKPRLNNRVIKLNYLHAVLSILNNPVVLESTLRTLNISIPATQDVYTTLVHLINDNSLDIDRILNLLVENNIASINKTLIFND